MAKAKRELAYQVDLVALHLKKGGCRRINSVEGFVAITFQLVSIGNLA